MEMDQTMKFPNHIEKKLGEQKLNDQDQIHLDLDWIRFESIYWIALYGIGLNGLKYIRLDNNGFNRI